MLVSPNNRPIGRSATYHDFYAPCREAVLDLQANAHRIVSLAGTVAATGQWTWRISLDDVLVAVSSRSYLRARECTYNLERFLEALPNAEIVDGTRSVRRDRRRYPEPSPVTGIHGAVVPTARPLKLSGQPLPLPKQGSRGVGR
ncbi:hypothetical protein ABZ807_22095 [Micromonospora sp. NPDC047548]|uniref:hypothetical protein n=1 Tax=Micromonospora sp. NPDC047548 TaxID=3155624 RepID=UPI003402A603